MKRANPKDLRQALQAANTYAKAGILFVAVPVMDAAGHSALMKQANESLSELIALAEAEESQS